MADLTLRGQYELATIKVESGEVATALSACRRILQHYPWHISSYSLLGQVCLQAGEHQLAADLFRRVLSADPEHALAYGSMGAIYHERGLIDEATWQYQRAHEVSPRNTVFREALRHLYSEIGLQPTRRVTMTRSALARTYLRGRLFGKAIGELRGILDREPYRLDLRVALAEALWRDGNDHQAEAVSQGIINELPHCLKANLILGQIWLNSERDAEGRQLLQIAQSLDPENTVAQVLFESRSPLPPKMVRLPLEDGELEPLDLPYVLSDDSEPVPTRAPVIEGKARVQPDKEILETPRAPVAPRVPSPPVVRPVQREIRSPHPHPTPEISQPNVKRSSIATRRAYLADHPDDRATRLQLARQYSAVGDMTHALEQYAHLVQDASDLPALIDELTMLNALSPGNMGLLNLLVLAKEKGVPAL